MITINARHNDQHRGPLPRLQYLTDKQRETLEAIAEKAPDYDFEVLCYSDSRPQIRVWTKHYRTSYLEYVALVGPGVAEVYGLGTEVHKIMRRLAHRVYRMRVD